MDIKEYCPRTSSHNEVANKDALRSEVSCDVAKFLLKGGKINNLDKRSKLDIESGNQASHDRMSASWNRNDVSIIDKKRC